MAVLPNYDCIVPDCKNTEEDESLKFYSLPYKDPEICKEWIRRIGGDPMLHNMENTQKICEIHFHYICKTGFDSQLHEKSLPTLYLPIVKESSKSIKSYVCFARISRTLLPNKSTNLKKEKISLQVENCSEVCRFCYRKGILYDIAKSIYNLKVQFVTVLKSLVPEYNFNSSNLQENICLDCAKLVITGYLTVERIRAASKAFSFVLEPLNNHKLSKRIANVLHPKTFDVKSILVDCDLKMSLQTELAYCPAKYVEYLIKKNVQDESVEVPRPIAEVTKIETDGDVPTDQKIDKNSKSLPKIVQINKDSEANLVRRSLPNVKVLTAVEFKRLKEQVENMPSTSKNKLGNDSEKTVVDTIENPSFPGPMLLLNGLRQYKNKRTVTDNHTIDEPKILTDNIIEEKESDEDLVSVKKEIQLEEEENSDSLSLLFEQPKSIIKEESNSQVESKESGHDTVRMKESIKDCIGIVENSIELLASILQKSENDHSMLINGEIDERDIADIFEEINRNGIDKEIEPNQKITKRKLLLNFSCKKESCKFSMDVCQDYVIKAQERLVGKAGIVCVVCDFKSANSMEHHKHVRSHKKHGASTVIMRGARIIKKHMAMEEVKCSDCGNMFKDIQRLKKHKKVVHGPSVECVICHKQIKEYYMRTHQTIHSRQDHSCMICLKSFRSLLCVRKHIENHTADEKYDLDCKLCRRKFKCELDLAIHNANHDQRKSNQNGTRIPPGRYTKLCPICGRSDYKNYFTHVLGHSKIKRFKCDMCSYETNFKMPMKRHQLIHTGEKPFLCTDCGQSFTQKGSLQSHSKMHVVLSQPIDCRICGESFRTKYDCQVHCQVHGISLLSKGPRYSRMPMQRKVEQTTRKRIFEKNANCLQCHKSFCNKNLLRMHVIEEHEKRKGYFKCGTCRKGFDTLATKNKHIIREHNTAGRTCWVCNNVFNSRKLLEIHMRSHTGERPHKCDLCPSMFHQSHHLSYHKMRIHEKRKPFACTVCNKAFPSKQNLNEHARTHTRERLKCTHCDKTFAGSSNKNKHMREVHNIIQKPLCVKIV